MTKPSIRKGQIWKSKKTPIQVLVIGKGKNDKFKVNILTDKPGFYAGRHTLARWTLWTKYELIT